MVIISDTSPISNLYRIGQLQLLKSLYQTVILPEMVLEELLALQNRGYDLRDIVDADWIVVKKPAESWFLSELKAELDPGEAEAIALAKELGAHLLIMDEIAGRAIAEREGLNIIGLLGVLLEAKNYGHVPAVKPLMDELVRVARFRIHPALYLRILELADESI